MGIPWSIVHAHLAARWSVVASGADWSGLQIDVEGDRRKVVVKQTTDAAVIVIAAQVCPVGWLPSEEALVYNGIAEHGMLMLERGVYVLRQLVAPGQTGWEELDRIIATMAAEAAHLRRCIGVAVAPADPAALLAHVVD